LGPRVPVVLLFLLVAAKIAVSEPQACYGMNTTDQILAYDASEIHTISRGWQRSNVSDQDDGCFDRQRLPFAFPWRVDNSEDYISISPNGGLHFGMNPEQCCNPRFRGDCNHCYFANLGTCDLSGEKPYRNLIAAFVTDLHPGVSSQASIEFASGPDAYMVKYSKVPFYFQTSPPEAINPLTFEATLFGNGNIRLRLINITDPTSVCCWTLGSSVGNRQYSVGVRLPRFESETFTATSNVDSWNTTAEGYFPPVGFVRSGVTIDFIRKPSIEFCVYPSYIAPNSTYPGVTFYLSSGCTVCGSCQWEADIPGYTDKAVCELISNRYFICSVTFMAYPSVGSVLNLRLYKVGDDFSSYMDPIEVTIVSQTSPLITRVQHDELRKSEFCTKCTNSTNIGPECPVDCVGLAGGTAVLDSCGVCTNGTSGNTYNSDADCAGVCFGPYVTLNDTLSCACFEGAEKCTNISKGFAQDTSNPSCISPNASQISGGGFVYLSTMKSGPDSNVSCVFGDSMTTTGMFSSVNQTSRCPVPDGSSFFAGRNVSSVFVTVKIAFPDTIDFFPTGFIALEYLTDTHPRYNDTDVIDFSNPFSRCFSCEFSYTTFCRKDCLGIYQGEAIIDDCGNCTGGQSNMTFNAAVDCAGLCNGPFRELSTASGGTACYCPGGYDGECDVTGLRTSAQGAAGANPTSYISSVTCASPKVMSQEGGDDQIKLRIGIQTVLHCRKDCNIQCKIGDTVVPAIYLIRGFYVECNEIPPFEPSPSGNATVAISVLVNNNVIASAPIAMTYLAPGSPQLDSLVNISSVFRFCETCHPVTNNTCYRDCNGTWLGVADYDACGECSGGETGIVPNSKADCQGVCNGSYTLLSGGICACTDIRERCVSDGRKSTLTAQKEETLCIHPYILQTADPTTITIVGPDLKIKPTQPLEIRIGMSSGLVFPVSYDPSLETLTAQLPPGLTTNNATVSAQILSAGVPTGPWMFLTLDPSRTTAEQDESICGSCSRFNPTFCQIDCNNDERGTANYDDCGICTEGNTGKIQNQDKDCKGICFGPFQLSYNDECICPSSNADCANYNRLDGSTNDSESFEDITGFYIALAIITSVIAGGALFWYAWVRISRQDTRQLSGLPPCLERLLGLSEHRYAQLHG